MCTHCFFVVYLFFTGVLSFSRLRFLIGRTQWGNRNDLYCHSDCVMWFHTAQRCKPSSIPYLLCWKTTNTKQWMSSNTHTVAHSPSPKDQRLLNRAMDRSMCENIRLAWIAIHRSPCLIDQTTIKESTTFQHAVWFPFFIVNLIVSFSSEFLHLMVSLCWFPACGEMHNLCTQFSHYELTWPSLSWKWLFMVLLLVKREGIPRVWRDDSEKTIKDWNREEN